jgi:hypothetical protein
VIKFRQAYADEREQLAVAVRKLLLQMSVPDPASESDPAQAQREIEKAVHQIKKSVQQLAKGGHSEGIVWLKRSLLVLGGLGAAAAGVYLLPLYVWLFTALSGLGIGAASGINVVRHRRYHASGSPPHSPGSTARSPTPMTTRPGRHPPLDGDGPPGCAGRELPRRAPRSR